MQAIVSIAGTQVQVSKDQELVVPRLAAEPNATVEFGDIVMTIDGDAINVGGGGTVTATVLEHGHAGTVVVFQKKRRKGFRRMRGHRQGYTKIRVTGISA